MATISERENKDGSISYKVAIRKKDHEIFSTFSDLETAKMWAHYKESLIDEMQAFDIPKGNLLTLEDLKELKNKENIEKQQSFRYKIECNQYANYWIESLGVNRSIASISYDDLYQICEAKMNEKIVNRQSGGLSPFSSRSMIKRLAVLSTWFVLAQREGCNVENHPLKIIQVLRHRKD